jgi:hypothetical protein
LLKGYTMKENYEDPVFLKTRMRVDEHGVYRWRIGS